jgi:hypothetical protein
VPRDPGAEPCGAGAQRQEAAATDDDNLHLDDHDTHDDELDVVDHDDDRPVIGSGVHEHASGIHTV